VAGDCFGFFDLIDGLLVAFAEETLLRFSLELLDDFLASLEPAALGFVF